MSEENNSVDWKEGLPTELAGHPSLADIKDIGSLAKQFIDTKAYQGSSVRIPSPDEGTENMKSAMQKIVDKVPGLTFAPNLDDPDSVRGFMKSLGTPEDPNGYKVPEVEGVPFGEDIAKQYKEIAHKNGLTASQFQGLMQDILEGDKQALESSQQKNAEDKAALAREWGQATQEKQQQIARFVEKVGGPADIVSMLKEGTAGSDVYKMFDSIINNMGKEGNELTQQLPTVSGKTVDEIEEELSGIRKNPDMWDASSPNYKRLNAKVLSLTQELVKVRGAKDGATGLPGL